MSESFKIKVGISVGDPNGIGFEIILKTFEDKRIFDFFTPIVFAHPQNLIEERNKLGLNLEVFSLKNIKTPQNGQLNIIKTWDQPFHIIYGEQQEQAGKHALRSLQAATEALKNELIDVLVTAPINKKSIQSSLFQFKGHTDYLNKQLEGESLMFMVTDSLKIALLSDHIPIGDILNFITPERVDNKIRLLVQSLKCDYGIINPKIAVLGINPHAGDNGVIGQEDDTLLNPIIKKHYNNGESVFGPFAADGFFGSQTYLKYDAVLAMYHDQGLIPFKTLSFGKGVNFTAGLNRIRTSPDHGTAFDIAGMGKANNGSFCEAIYKAREIFLNRKKFESGILESFKNKA